jgi:hypothetical protein
VHSELGALGGVQRPLEEGAEDRGLHRSPVEPGSRGEYPQLCGLQGQRVPVGEEAAIETRYVFEEEVSPGGHGREELPGILGKPFGLLPRPLDHPPEEALGEQAHVLGEEAEEELVQEVGGPEGVLAAGVESISQKGELLGSLGGYALVRRSRFL